MKKRQFNANFFKILTRTTFLFLLLVPQYGFTMQENGEYYDVVTKNKVSFGWFYSRNMKNHNKEYRDYEIRLFQQNGKRNHLDNAEKYNDEFFNRGGEKKAYDDEKDLIKKLKKNNPTCCESCMGYLGQCFDTIKTPLTVITTAVALFHKQN